VGPDLLLEASSAASAPAVVASRIVPGRACGSCTLCCKVVGVLEIGKAAGAWCPHCAGAKRCTIYEARYRAAAASTASG
jgi:hypothetical protein